MPTSHGSSGPAPQRIISLDQFRGYSVAGMFVVNFLGGLAVTHHVLKHNNTHFSYADSIMPSFIFICGFSFRMTFLKRSQLQSGWAIHWGFVVRSLGLIWLSLMLFGFNGEFSQWSEISPGSLSAFAALLLKANLWEVLAIIGAIQIICLPIIGWSSRGRVLACLLLGGLHLWLSAAFNYDFVYGRPNWLDASLGTSGKRAWDGGLFGLLPWSQIMLAGTLAYDLVIPGNLRRAAWQLLSLGCVAMSLGYGLSCLTRLYDVAPAGPVGEMVAANPVMPVTSGSPVWPDWSKGGSRARTDWLAEPPFVPPPSVDQRLLNYWMMDKRIVTPSFVLFSSGFALAVYAMFVWLCDVRQLALGLFRTFGQNPLAAYIINHFVNDAVLQLIPKDAPLGWVILGLLAAFGTTYVFVRFLERRGLYLRL